MAKEQLHSWSRTIITIISLAFVCGITYKSIGDNTDDIVVNTADIKTHAKENAEHEKTILERVHKTESRQERDIALKELLLSGQKRMEIKMDEFSTAQDQIKLDVNTTKVKIDTLTKD